jgi:hypothetical protein
VNLCSFYSYRLIGPETDRFLHLQEFSLRNRPVDCSVVVYVLTLTLESITSRTHTHPSHSETSLFSLSSHRHLYIGLLFTSSLYRFIINKQQKKEANPKNSKNGTSCPSSGECGGNKTREGVSREGVRRGGGQRRERMKRGRDMM